MSRSSARALVACLAGLLSLAAHAGPGMAVYLRSYYTEYEVILDCSGQDHLTAADAATAKDAMAKIEAYYLQRELLDQQGQGDEGSRHQQEPGLQDDEGDDEG